MAESKLYKKIVVALSVVFCISIVLTFGANVVSADTGYDEEGNEYPYEYYILDNANLLTDAEEFLLSETLISCTRYANVALLTVDYNEMSTQRLASHTNDELFSSNGIVFVIDMDKRYLYLDSTGAARSYITGNNADTITDNIYQYASAEDYYKCANECFKQVLNLMEGKRIAKPMKYIGNAILALVIGFFIFFLVVKNKTKIKPATNAEMMNVLRPDFDIYNANASFIKQTRVYHSSGSGGGHGGGGHGGGGGHSGGGHGF